jgi:flagellar basal body rod protein FlgG
MKLDRVFGGLNISSAGLSAQRQRMNAIAENLANAETTRTETGGPYKRKIVQLKARSAQLFAGMMRQSSAPLATTQPGHISTGTAPGAEASEGCRDCKRGGRCGTAQNGGMIPETRMQTPMDMSPCRT